MLFYMSLGEESRRQDSRGQINLSVDDGKNIIYFLTFL